MINFIEHTHTGYALRTQDNAKLAPATIYFAVNFNSPGCLLTRKCCYGKPFIKIDISEYKRLTDREIMQITDDLRGHRHLNIAGNSLHTLRGKYTQEGVNAAVYDVLDKLHAVNPIESVRSGGQSGVDIAGLLWSDDRGIPAIALFPKGWQYRNEAGQEVFGQTAFLKRFPRYSMDDIF